MIESFPDITIFASRLEENSNEAFIKKFQSVIHFPMPDAQEYLRL